MFKVDIYLRSGAVIRSLELTKLTTKMSLDRAGGFNEITWSTTKYPRIHQIDPRQIEAIVVISNE